MGKRGAAILVAIMTAMSLIVGGRAALADGDISGTVSDGTAPIVGVTVTASDVNDPYVSVATTTTAADGSYSLANLADGNYVVGFAKTGYLTTYYGGQHSVDNAVANGDQVTVPWSGADVVMPSDVIDGTVEDADGNPLEDVTVTVYDGGGDPAGDDTTDADGTFAISMGADGFGDVVVKFAKSGFITQFNGGWSTFDDAMSSSFVAVPATVDWTMSSDSITGTVKDQDTDLVLAGVTVTVYDLSQVEVGTDTTDANGAYAISVGAEGAGDYVVGFARAGYPTVFHNGSGSLVDATGGSTITMPGADAVDVSLVPGEPQTITFAALVERKMADSPLTVSASASSGLGVSFSSTTTAVCTVSGTTVTLVTTGTCTVRASQAGDETWATAAAVDRSFVVAAEPTPEPDEDEDDEEEPPPVRLPTVERPGAAPVIVVDRPVALPDSGLVTRSVRLSSGGVALDIPAGTSVMRNGEPAAVILHAPEPSDRGTAAFRFTTSLGDDVTFSPPLTVTVTIPAAEASAQVASVTPPLFVPVELGADGAIGCLAGTEAGSTMTFAISRPGTYALRGPERPVVVDSAPVVIATPGLHSRWAGQSESATACAGQLVDIAVRLTNAGSESWVHGTATQVNLGSSGPPGNTRDFEAGVLYAPLFNQDRFATTAESRVDPGKTATFAFRIRAPALSGPYRVQLRPVVEGVRWLEDEGIYLELEVR